MSMLLVWVGEGGAELRQKLLGWKCGIEVWV